MLQAKVRQMQELNLCFPEVKAEVTEKAKNAGYENPYTIIGSIKLIRL